MRLPFGLDRLARPNARQDESEPPQAEHVDAREDRARTYNWTGYQLLRLALESPGLDADEIFQDAVRQFEDASAALPKWSVALENRADAWSYLGELRSDPDLQTKAIALYAEATQALDQPGGGLPSARKRRRDEQKDAAENASVKKELSQSIAICKLLREPGMRTTEVDSLVANELGIAWDPSTETSGDVLYTSACLLARASAITKDGALRTKAIHALANAFYVDHALTTEAHGDPDLASIRVTVDGLRALDWKTLAAKPPSRTERLEKVLAGYV
jgi:hypothetical protein